MNKMCDASIAYKKKEEVSGIIQSSALSSLSDKKTNSKTARA